MIIDNNMLAAISSGSFHFEWLVWIEAKNRQTGAVETIGVHTGLDDFRVNIDGETRLYSGVGALIEVPNFEFSMGLGVNTKEFKLAILAPEVAEAIRLYDSRLAPIEVHLAVFNSDMTLAGIAPVLKGWIDNLSITTNDVDAYCSIGVVSNVRAGTKSLPFMKSEESQKLRDPTDSSFKYSAITKSVDIQWAAGSGPQYKGFMQP